MKNSDPRPLHVLVVDDSAVVREVMTAILTHEPDLSVTVAADPLIAMDKMRQRRPDVILLDLEMPRMDGLTFLEKLMREDPLPVVICSARAGEDASMGLRALEKGAVEVVTKPRIGVREYLNDSAVTLTDAVRAAAKARRRLPRVACRSSQKQMPAEHVSAVPPTIKVVAIGASTGGTEALRVILEAMPSDAPGMVVVQHMPEGFTAAFAQRLNEMCRITVKEAADGDLVLPGQALIAPGNRHLMVHRSAGRMFAQITDGPLVSRHRPSLDVLFRSVAQAAGTYSIGVILTGMGHDGAQGLLEMKQAGALTIAQDEASCVVFGMPKEALNRGAVTSVVALSGISEVILNSPFVHRRAAVQVGHNQTSREGV